MTPYQNAPWRVGALFLVLLAGCPPRPVVRPEPAACPVPGLDEAQLFTHPIGEPFVSLGGEGEENFLQRYERLFILPRIYPGKELDPGLRLRAYEQLRRMREALKLKHRPAGWASGPQAPGTTGPGGCAWISVGPTNINGRVTSIAIDPSNAQRIFAASVGGLWRSTTGGRRWQRVSDDFLATVFASVAVNPANGNEAFAGGGDPNYHGGGPRSGLGIWRSTTGGDPGSWSKVSPAALDGGVVYRIRIDPIAPNDVYAATSAGVWLGTHSGTGMTWTRVGNFDAWTNDLAVDFGVTPRRLYAGVRAASATFGKGIWKWDGTSWQKRDTGITTASGRTIALALAASNHNVLYSKVENASNGRLLGVYKTTTAGETPSGGGNAWSALAGASVMDDSIFAGGASGYSWYNSVLEVDPANDAIVFAGGMNIFRTADGGTTWSNVSVGTDATYPLSVHADQHAVAFDPTNSKVVFTGNDGGIDRTTDTSLASWHWNDSAHGMVMTEFYRITSQQQIATVQAGGSQDNGTEITFGNRTWYNPGGCDGSDVAIDGQNGVALYANCNGGLYELVNPVPGTPGGGSAIAWTTPTGYGVVSPIVTDTGSTNGALSSGAPSVPATGTQRLLKTTDGITWAFASNAVPTGASITFVAVAPSSTFKTYYMGVLGVAGGPQIWRTSDGGTTWPVTTSTGLPNLWPTGAVVDDTNPSRAVATFGGTGSVFLTTDGGATWSSLVGSGATALPSVNVSGAAFEPGAANVVYVASDVGVFRGVITPGPPPSATWAPFDEGLPDGVTVTGIWANRTTGALRIGTMGHGAYRRDVRAGTTCPAAMMLVRDNVFDRGAVPSPSAVPDPEHPIPDPARPGFYKPDDTGPGRVYWWSSADIRVDVPSIDPPANAIANADHVEVESCPSHISSCPPATLIDSSPQRGRTANAYVQVNNAGIAPASNVRVVALWADATTGLPDLPADFWTTTFPAGGGACGALTAGSGWNLVDPANPCRTIPVVNPELPETARFAWSVPTTAADHSCMLAIVESLDDPVEPAVRTSNERRIGVLVPNHRQITLRNLHVVDVPPSPMPRVRLFAIDVVNPDPERRGVEVVVSAAGLERQSGLGLILPRVEPSRVAGLVREPIALDTPELERATKEQLDASAMWLVEGREGRLTIPIAPGQRARLGIVVRSGPGARPNSASRFTVLARQGDRILGGNTFLLRVQPVGRRAPAASKAAYEEPR